jgi:hypothetical protein
MIVGEEERWRKRDGKRESLYIPGSVSSRAELS